MTAILILLVCLSCSAVTVATAHTRRMMTRLYSTTDKRTAQPKSIESNQPKSILSNTDESCSLFFDVKEDGNWSSSGRVYSNGKDLRNTLIVFLIDESMPSTEVRINAVTGAVRSILPQGKIAIVGCYQDDAEVICQPTSSLLTANRELKKLSKSILGNLGKGLHLALDILDKSFDKFTETKNDDRGRDRIISNALLVVIADSKAHGLLASDPSECDVYSALEKCEGVDSATEIPHKADYFQKNGYNLKTIIIDTDSPKGANFDYTLEGGFKFAKLADADYYHCTTHSLTHLQLLTYLHTYINTYLLTHRSTNN